jgi:hypothetical protein
MRVVILKLHVIKLVIFTVQGKQILMFALLYNPAIDNDNDSVGTADGR